VTATWRAWGHRCRQSRPRQRYPAAGSGWPSQRQPRDDEDTSNARYKRAQVSYNTQCHALTNTHAAPMAGGSNGLLLLWP
jgi:hypothetical protein